MNIATESDTSRTKHHQSPDSELGQYIPLLYHYNMLQDQDRVGAFRQAIDLMVRPGMHVVELGGGTGILSSFAARRGARVTCVERNPELVEVARGFLEANGLSGSVTVVQADAAEFVPETPVDVVICEMLHVGLLREKQASVIHRFQSNYQNRFGPKSSTKQNWPVFIPDVTMMMVQPIEQDFDFAGYQAPVPMFQAPLLDQPRTIPLTSLHPYANLAYGETVPQRFAFDESVELSQSGYVNAVRLITQNVLALDEASQQATTWANQCLVLPLRAPFHADEGDRVLIRFEYRAGDSINAFQESLTVQPVNVIA